MEILCSALYEKQLKEILIPMLEENPSAAKHFKMYLDTLIINIPTKAKKFKKSIFFDDESIKDLKYEDYIIIFTANENNTSFIILGIVKKA